MLKIATIITRSKSEIADKKKILKSHDLIFKGGSRLLVLQFQLVMLRLIALLAISFLTENYDLARLLNNMWLHDFCLNHAPSSPWQLYYQSLVCGAPFPANNFAVGLKRSGLIHLMVVSGGHLLLIENLFQRCLFQKRLRVLVYAALFIYVLMTKGQPPAVRAFFAILISDLNKSLKLYWPQHHQVLTAGLLCLSLFPNWFSSLSFLLSWLASLGLSLTTNSLKSALVFIIMFPALLPLQAPHPLSVLCNMIIAPLINLLLFPLTSLTFLVHWVTVLTDRLWELLFQFSLAAAQWLPPLIPATGITVTNLWIYLILIHLLAHGRQILGGRQDQCQAQT